MLLEPFERSIYPFLVEIGGMMFVYSFCKLGYRHFRHPDWKVLIDGIYGTFIAYGIIKGAFVALKISNGIIESIH